MKQMFLTLIAVFVAVCGVSQTQEHLSFKGIPITGTMSSFCQQLKAKGFTQVGRDSNYTLFTGDFTGKTVELLAVSDSDGKNVLGVVVLLDPSEEWNRLTSTYDYYKDLYISKYGNPKMSKEYNPAYGDSNIAKMAEVHQGTVAWGSLWQITGGTIELSIEKSNGFYEGLVVIRYRDEQNIENKMQNDIEDI